MSRSRTSRDIRRVGAAALLAAALGPSAARAQGVPTALSGLDASNGEAWIAPFADALAPAMTAGFFITGGRGGSAGIGLRISAGIIPAADGSFEALLPGSVDFEGASYSDPYVVAGVGGTPSVSGAGPGARLVPRPGSAFEAALDAAGVQADRRAAVLPAGLDLSRAPLPTIEATLPLRGLGLQLVGRFTPTVELFDELGDVSAFGAGVLATVSRFLPGSPVHVGVTAMTQKIQGADWLEGSASAFGVVVSRRIGPVEPWVHGLLTTADVDVRWTVANPDAVPFLPVDGTTVRIRREYGRDARVAVGASLGAGPVDVAAEYSPGARDVLSVRLTLIGH